MIRPSSPIRTAAAPLVVITLTCVALFGCRTAPRDGAPDEFSFATAGDMRQFTQSTNQGKRYFDGACEALREIGPGAFMITPGDFDPPAGVRATLDRYLGTNYLWYPLVGNHETETPADMAWVKQWSEAGIPNLVRSGPPGAESTMFSFDFGNSHFAAIDQYFDGQKDGKTAQLSEATLEWLEQDLAATRKPLIWVIGHSPIKSLPDMDANRVRHGTESVSTNAVMVDRFVEILLKHRVRAFICGHTHNTSVEKVRGIWQADSGHARGAGDTGSPSTFLKFRVSGTRAWVDVYRSNTNGMNYALRKTVALD